MNRYVRLAAPALLCLSACSNLLAEEVRSITGKLRLPVGFSIAEVVAVPNARSLAMGDNDTLFVSSQIIGMVHAVRGVSGPTPEVVVIDAKLRFPNGVAFADGDLYVAEMNRVLRYRDIESKLDDPGEPEVVVDDLPGKARHGWKYIAFGPDGKLYVTVGSPCNVCDEPDYGQIIRMNKNGTEREVYARGIRNSVGLDWQPASGDLWFTDNNRDMMSDDEPAGELNRVSQAGQHFGFPFCHGIDTVEPEAELAALGSCADAQPPVQELGAHVAPLGLAFYDGGQFPAEYQNQIFIAEHGSWNRSDKIGYRVTLVTLDESGSNALSYKPFIEGWLDEGEVLGRPVDVLVAADGSLLVSDDKAGMIYRVSYDVATKD
jgi:glucose/arabinose dehydrogenase